MDALRVGIIGYGYWGPNLARNFYEIPESDLVVVADKKEDQLSRAKSKYPQIITTQNYEGLFNMGLDAVVVATPPKSHYKIAKECLENGINVLVEKPLTLNSEDAEKLIKLADEKKLVLMVGHTFEYNSAVLELKKYIQQKTLGEIYYIDAARLNLGLFQRDSNVIWDLAPHDISTLIYLLDQLPISVSTHGMTCVQKDTCDVAYINLVFPNDLRAFVHVSWLDPCKVRRFTVVGDKKMAVYNDLGLEGKIKIYDKGVDAPEYTDGFSEFQYAYRSGDITMPNFRYSEPLREECMHFINSVMNKTEPRSSGRSGLRVIKILEAAQRSLENGSTYEVIKW